MNNREIYYSPDIPTVYKSRSNIKRNKTNQIYYYKSHLKDYLSQQFSSITSKIGSQQVDVKKYLSHQIENKTQELLRKYQSQVIFQEKVNKEIKDEIDELITKMNQFKVIQEQVSEKLLQNLVDAKTYLSDKQSSNYEQLSEKINQVNESQSENYKMVQELFMSILNEVKAQVVVQGQVSREAINDIEKRLEHVLAEFKYESKELVAKLIQLEEIQEQVSIKLKQDIEHTKTYLTDKQSAYYEQISEELKQSMDYVDAAQIERNKALQELFLSNHNEVTAQLIAQEQVNREAIDEINNNLKNVGKEIKNETDELVNKLNQMEEIQNQIGEKIQKDIDDTKNYLSDKQSSHYQQLSEEINQCVDYAESLQCEKFKSIQELIMKSHIETQERFEIKGQMCEAIEKKLNNVIEAITSLNQEESPVEKYQSLFNLGDRISIYGDGGKTFQSGVFIYETDLYVMWVNDSTNKLNLTNKKGLSMVRE